MCTRGMEGVGGGGGVDLTEGLKVFFLAIQGGSVLTIKQIKYMQYVVSLFLIMKGNINSLKYNIIQHNIILKLQ